MRSRKNAVAALNGSNAEKQDGNLQRTQVRHQHLQFLLVKLAAERWHHAAAANDALHHVLVRCGQVFFVSEYNTGAFSIEIAGGP